MLTLVSDADGGAETTVRDDHEAFTGVDDDTLMLVSMRIDAWRTLAFMLVLC